jgi:hypothetical protein
MNGTAAALTLLGILVGLLIMAASKPPRKG